MRWIDSRGRLLGIFSLVDLAAILFLLGLAPMGIYLQRCFSGWDPVIEVINPPHIKAGESSRVLLLGHNLQRKSIVRLENTPVPSFDFESPYRLVLNIPPLKEGLYDISVTNTNGSTDTRWDRFEVVPVPQVLEVVPRRMISEEGGWVRLLGKDFQPEATLEVGNARPDEIHWVSSREMIFHVPPAAVLGFQTVRLRNRHGIASETTEGFCVVPGELMVTLLLRLPDSTLGKLQRQRAEQGGWDPPGIRIQRILQQGRGSRGSPGWAIAAVLLSADLALQGSERGYLFQGEPLSLNRRIDLQFEGEPVAANILSPPMPRREYDRQFSGEGSS